MKRVDLPATALGAFFFALALHGWACSPVVGDASATPPPVPNVLAEELLGVPTRPCPIATQDVRGCVKLSQIPGGSDGGVVTSTPVQGEGTGASPITLSPTAGFTTSGTYNFNGARVNVLDAGTVAIALNNRLRWGGFASGAGALGPSIQGTNSNGGTLSFFGNGDIQLADFSGGAFTPFSMTGFGAQANPWLSGFFSQQLQATGYDGGNSTVIDSRATNAFRSPTFSGDTATGSVAFTGQSAAAASSTNGAAVALTSGNGGSGSPAPAPGGDGGVLTISGGNGGTSSTAQAGGNGGAVNINPGFGGTSGSGPDGAAGRLGLGNALVCQVDIGKEGGDVNVTSQMHFKNGGQITFEKSANLTPIAMDAGYRISLGSGNQVFTSTVNSCLYLNGAGGSCVQADGDLLPVASTTDVGSYTSALRWRYVTMSTFAGADGGAAGNVNAGNTMTGTACIASGAKTMDVTNGGAALDSRVNLTPIGVPDATCSPLGWIPGTGKFSVVCGVNATANACFSWALWR